MTRRVVVKNGKQEYVDLSSEEEAEHQARIDLFNSPEEVEKRRQEAITDARNERRGDWRHQLHILIKYGLPKLQEVDAAIEAEIPRDKPRE